MSWMRGCCLLKHARIEDGGSWRARVQCCSHVELCYISEALCRSVGQNILLSDTAVFLLTQFAWMKSSMIITC
jgi:hypothetical protein